MVANLNLPDPRDIVAMLMRRARVAQGLYQGYTQAQVDEVVTAAGWAIMKPENNRVLADLAVADSGLGNAQDKFDKNYRKTLGLLRDLKGAKSVGVIAEYPQLGLVEIARPVGVVAVIIAPSPKGLSTCVKLLEFVHAEFAKIGAPAD